MNLTPEEVSRLNDMLDYLGEDENYTSQENARMRQEREKLSRRLYANVVINVVANPDTAPL